MGVVSPLICLPDPIILMFRDGGEAGFDVSLEGGWLSQLLTPGASPVR